MLNSRDTNTRLIYVAVSEQCNLDCAFCLLHPRGKSVLNVEAFLKWFNNYQSLVEEDITLCFYGGEALLQTPNILKIIENTNCNYSIFTNLTCNITSEMRNILNSCSSIITSWDPISLRFKTQERSEIWKRNCKEFKIEYVSVILTKELLEFDPVEILENFISCNITNVSFSGLVKTGAAINLESPNWSCVDDWLCRVYDIKSKIKIDIFEHFMHICKFLNSFQSYDKMQWYKTLWYKMNLFDFNSAFHFKIKPDGKFDADYKELNLSIFDPAEKTKTVLSKLYRDNKLTLQCRTCDLYWYCTIDDHILYHPDPIKECIFPRKLFKKIAIDYNPDILVTLEI